MYTDKTANISMTNCSRKLKLVSNDCLGNVVKPCGKTHKHSDLIVFRILIKSLNIREKSQNSRGGIPTKKFTTQQPKVIECLNWYQMIDMVMFYHHRIRFMKNLTS